MTYIVLDASPWGILLFSYTTKVVWLGNIAESFDVGDLPIVPASMRATYNYARMRKALREIKLKIFSWSPAPGTGWNLIWRLIRLNYAILLVVLSLVTISTALSFASAFFMRKFVQYLEVDRNREDKEWGWFYVVGLFVANVLAFLRKFFSKKKYMQILIDNNSYRATLVTGHHNRSSSTYNPTKHSFIREDSCPKGCCLFCPATVIKRW